MPQLTLTTTIKGSPTEVFDVLEDFEHAADRISDIKNIEVLTEGTVRVGTRFRETRAMFNQEHIEELAITAMDPGKPYVVECASCGCIYTTMFRFAPDGAETQVEMHMKARPVSLFAKIVSPLTNLMFGAMMRKCMTKDMEDLKSAIET